MTRTLVTATLLLFAGSAMAWESLTPVVFGEDMYGPVQSELLEAVNPLLFPNDAMRVMDVPTQLAMTDLNGDGTDEALLMLIEETAYCDHLGCLTFVLQRDRDGWLEIGVMQGHWFGLEAGTDGWMNILATQGPKGRIYYRHKNERFEKIGPAGVPLDMSTLKDGGAK
ncbi:MAG: hypothetical protein U9N14_06645 [Pseudomonadota bacterium]|nr:hypothetical protein [Pseudomonadota bacterium]